MYSVETASKDSLDTSVSSKHGKLVQNMAALLLREIASMGALDTCAISVLAPSLFPSISKGDKALNGQHIAYHREPLLWYKASLNIYII